MPQPPLNEQDSATIRARKTAYWAQDGIGREYHSLVMERKPRTQLKNLNDISFVRRHVTGNHILDMGAGTGRFTLPLAAKGAAMTAMDVSREMIAVCRDELAARGLPIRTLQGDAAHLPFPDNEFDSVISMTVLRHFPNWRDLLAEVVRVTKPNGRIVVDLASGEQHLYRDALNVPELSPYKALKEAEGYEAAATHQEICDTARALDIRVVATCPFEVFNENALLNHYLGEHKNAFYEELDKLLQSPQVLAFCEQCCRALLPHLSPAIAPTVMLVLEKRPYNNESSPMPASSRLPSRPAASAEEFLDACFAQCDGVTRGDNFAALRDTANHPDVAAFLALLGQFVLPRLPLNVLDWRDG